MKAHPHTRRIAATLVCTTLAAALPAASQGHKSNTSTGQNAGSKATTGKNNTADGFKSLSKNKTGSFNTAVGSNALKKATGDSNVGIGYEALKKNKGGQFNVAIGDGAMKFNVNGSNNVALGMDAGALTNGHDNILIDHQGVAGESGTVRIGTPGTHKKTVIAGKIIGNGSGLTGVTAVSAASAGSLTGFITGSQIASGTVGSNQLASNLRLSGTLGLGTSSPDGALDVRGGNLVVTGSGLSASLDLTAFDPSGNEPGTRISAVDDGAFGAHLDLRTKQRGANANPLVTRMRLTSEGDIGIATTSPGARLHVKQTSTARPALLLEGGEAEGVNTPTRTGLAFSYFDSPISKHFITTNHSVSTPANNKMSFWLNNRVGSSTNDQPGSGTNRVMTLTGAGNVGIGTNNPTKARLEITNFVNTTVGTNFFFNSGGTANGAGGNQSLAIWADLDIAARQFIAPSDERIKNIVGRSDSAVDLATVRSIEITDYTYKDTVANGKEVVKKVIAQQVEKVYPKAIKTVTNVIPDIYKAAPMKDGWVRLGTDLKPGDRVRLITGDAAEVCEVLEVEVDRFRASFDHDDGEIFVYGREVDDFRAVDYEAIAMLNVSATQELARQLELKDKRIAELERKLMAKDDELETRLASLERLMETKASTDQQTVSVKTRNSAN